MTILSALQSLECSQKSDNTLAQLQQNYEGTQDIIEISF